MIRENYPGMQFAACPVTCDVPRASQNGGIFYENRGPVMSDASYEVILTGLIIATKFRHVLIECCSCRSGAVDKRIAVDYLRA